MGTITSGFENELEEINVEIEKAFAVALVNDPS